MLVKSGSLLCALLLCFSSVHAQAQVGDPVETYLSSAEQKANNVVYNAGAQGRGVAMEAGQAVLNGISAFRAAYADSLTKTESALTGQQEEFFRKIRVSNDKLDETLKTSTADLQTITDTMAGAISNLPFSSDIPRVTKISPLYAVDASGPAQELVIRGLGLSNGSPAVDVANRLVKPNTTSDAEIRFPMPQHGPVSDKPLLFSAKLHLFQRDSKYLGLWHDYIPKDYAIRLAIYPQEIGSFTVVPRRRVATHETSPKQTQQYRCVSPHGEGSSSVPAQVVPDSGWSIDVSTISYAKEYENNGAFTMNTTSPAGFTGTLTCSGFGKRVVLGQTVDAGSEGVEQGHFTYTEVRDGTSLQNGDPIKKMLRWGDSLTVADLPADTETILFELKPFSGETLQFEGAGSNRFVKVDFNSASKVATVTAFSIEHALREPQ
jgi:hypothetical protein